MNHASRPRTSLRRFLLLFGFLGIALVGTAGMLHAEEATDPLPKTDANELIQLLTDGDFDERADAELALRFRGNKVADVLNQALLKSTNLEIQETLKNLLAALDFASLQLEFSDFNGRIEKELPVKISWSRVYETPNFNPFNRAINSAKKKKDIYTTDKRGFITIPNLRPGTYQFAIHPQGGRENMGSKQHLIFCASGLNRFRRLVPEKVTISGIVISSKTGKPLEDATVVLIPYLHPNSKSLSLDAIEANPNWLRLLGIAVKPSSTDKEGKFEIIQFGGKTFRAIISCERHSSYLSDPLTVGQDNSLQLKEAITLNAKEEKALGVIKIPMIDAEGKPLKEIDVQAQLIKLLSKDERKAFVKQIVSQRSLTSLVPQKLPNLSTDKEGLLEIKDLTPGTYYVALTHGEKKFKSQYQIEVEAGKTALIEASKVLKPGSLIGTIQSSKKRHYNQAWALPKNHPIIEFLPELRNRQDLQYLLRKYSDQDRTRMFSNSGNEFKASNLAPGEYVVFVWIYSHGMAIVYDVKVETDKETKIPDIKIEIPVLKTSSGNTVNEIKVTAQLPDGSPAESAQIRLTFINGGSTSSNIRNEGTYTFNLSNGSSLPKSISLTLAGYRSTTLDLTTGHHDFQNIQMVLRKLQYGKLRVSVKTPSGDALQGVQVWLDRYQTNRYRNNTVFKRHHSNAKGQTLFKGLATGPRNVHASHPGYFQLKQEQEVGIKAEETVEVTITMKPGFSLSGRLLPPKNSTFSNKDQLVYLASEAPAYQSVIHIAATNDQGKFSFKGLTPGKVFLVPAIPGYLPLQTVCVNVTDADVADVVLQPVRPRTLEMTLGKHLKSYFGAFSMPTPGKDDSIQKDSYLLLSLLGRSTLHYNQHVEPDGKIRFEKVVPGTYRLTLTAPQRPKNNFRVTEQRIINKIIVPDISDKDAGTSTYPLQDHSLPPATGAVNGKLVISEALKISAQNRTVVLTLTNPHAKGLVQKSISSQNRSKLIEINLPKNMTALKSSDPTAFDLTHLPAGTYTLKATLFWHNYQSGTRTNGKIDLTLNKEAPKTITLEPNKPYDLGTLTLSLSKEGEQELKRAMLDIKLNRLLNIGIDRKAQFQP